MPWPWSVLEASANDTAGVGTLCPRRRLGCVARGAGRWCGGFEGAQRQLRLEPPPFSANPWPLAVTGPAGGRLCDGPCRAPTLPRIPGYPIPQLGHRTCILVDDWRLGVAWASLAPDCQPWAMAAETHQCRFHAASTPSSIADEKPGGRPANIRPSWTHVLVRRRLMKHLAELKAARAFAVEQVYICSCTEYVRRELGRQATPRAGMRGSTVT